MDIQTLTQIGGSEWQRAGKHRVYFNDLASWYGLETHRYHSGKISAAWLNGEKISNSQATRLAGDLAYGKVWYDAADGRFYSQNLAPELASAIIEAIRAEAAAGEAPASTPAPTAEPVASDAERAAHPKRIVQDGPVFAVESGYQLRGRDPLYLVPGTTGAELDEWHWDTEACRPTREAALAYLAAEYPGGYELVRS